MFDRGRIRFLSIHAVKHGAFAKTAILPGEDRREFEELHSALIEEWAPVGPTEEDAVLSIAKGVWRKRRLQKFRHAEIEIWRSDPEHPLYDDAEGLRNLLNIIDAAPSFAPTDPPEGFENIRENIIENFVMLAIERTPSYNATTLKRICPREKFESISNWLAMLRVTTSALLRGDEQHGEEPDLLLDRSAKVHTPDVVNHELAVDERIDAMIDRAVKRLVQTKAMKQMLVSTSPRGGDDQPPKKIQTASLRDQDEHSG